MKKTVLERFEEKYVPEPNSGCWLWIGGYGPRGYGAFYNKEENRMIAAHRISYSIFKGKIPDGNVVCHKCDVTSCVNPNHLFIGTQKDNVNDCWSKGRGKIPLLKGEKSNGSKLNESQVRYIRDSSKTLRALSKELGISNSAVCLIKNKKSYKEVL